jgi:hypothetical protein
MLQGTLLIVHAGAMGDFILTWPALIRLKRAGYRLSAVLPSRSLGLGLRFGLIDEGLDMDIESRSVLPFFAGDRLPGCVRPDGAILWMDKDEGITNLIRSSAFLPVLFIDPKPLGPGHAARFHCEAIRQGYPVESVDNLILGFPDARPFGRTALIHPGSGSRAKSFSPDCYRKIGDKLIRLGFQTAYLLGPAELDSGLQESFQSEPIIRSTTVDFLADQLNQTGLFIGNDSGPSHLTGFMGVPTISLFRSTDPAVWGAIGRKVGHLKGNNESELVESMLLTIQKWLRE